MAHVATITIDHTKVAGDLTDYVGLIVPDGSAGYSALYALCLEGGGDIRLFKSDDTTELAREIVTFSVSAETGEIHYKYSGTLSSSVDTDIHVYADGSSSDYAVGATYGRNAVWSDYEFVYHGGTVDSTGAVTLSNTAASSAETSDVPFGAESRSFDGGGTDQINTNYNGRTSIGTDDFTFQVWFKTAQINARRTMMAFTSGGGGYEDVSELRQDAAATFNYGITQENRAGSSGGGPVSAPIGFQNSVWHQAHYTRQGTTGRIYINADLEDTETDSDIGVNVGPRFSVGGFESFSVQTVDGLLDESRVRKSRLLANWITTEYNNQNSYSTFYSVAAVAGGSAAQAARRGAVMMM